MAGAENSSRSRRINFNKILVKIPKLQSLVIFIYLICPISEEDLSVVINSENIGKIRRNNYWGRSMWIDVRSTGGLVREKDITA